MEKANEKENIIKQNGGTEAQKQEAIKELEEKTRNLEKMKRSFLAISQTIVLETAIAINKEQGEGKTEKADRTRLNLQRIKISLGPTVKEEQNKEEGKEEVSIKLISTRLEERAIKKLGEALRAMKKEPIFEVIKGDEEVWKVPYSKYHICAKMGKPRQK